MRDNICIIISKLNGGGAERSASNISILLSNHYNIHLIVFDGTNIKYPYKGQLHDLKLPPSKNKIFNIIRRVKKVKKIKKQYNIKYSISFMDGPNIINVFSKRRDYIFTSVRNQMSSSKKTNGFIEKMIIRFIEKKSTKIIALSYGVKNDLIFNYGVKENKVDVIYNPCDAEMLIDLANKKNTIPKDKNLYVITTMGRLTTQKGQWHLIRAFEKVKEEIKNIKLQIIGEGPLLDKLQKLVCDLKLQDNVEFLGFIENPHNYIINSDIFVFPSLFEGLGNVLLEALSCGVACVSSDCPSGPREILTGEYYTVIEKLSEPEFAKYGVLTSICDEKNFDAISKLTIGEEQMADAIIKLIRDNKLRNEYKKLGKERSKDFLPDKIGKEWINIMENGQRRN